MSENSSTKKRKQSQHHQQQQHIVGVHYSLGNKIGEGSFGIIFEGMNLLYNNTTNANMTKYVAIKFEPRKSDTPQLKDEYRAYKILKNQPHVPKVYYYGQEGLHNILIIDLLGPSLEDLFEWCGRQFSIKTCSLLAIQMIDTLKTIHCNNLIYRDIKPDNFLIAEYQLTSYIASTNNNGSSAASAVTTSTAASISSYNPTNGNNNNNNNNTSSNNNSTNKIICNNNNEFNDPNYVYIVDFGMAKQFRDPISKQHIPYREKKSLSGTARYMSINTHLGKEQSRRDDLESLGHVFFYFLRGQLPWQGLKAANNKLKYEKIGKTKQASSVDFLCMNGKIPWQFGEFLRYARNLKFEEEPDYEMLKGLMHSVLEELNMANDTHYDWMDLNGGRGWDIRLNKRNNLNGYGGGNTNNLKQQQQQQQQSSKQIVNSNAVNKQQKSMENLKQIQRDQQRLQQQQMKIQQNMNSTKPSSSTASSQRRRSEDLKNYYLQTSNNGSMSPPLPNEHLRQQQQQQSKLRYSRYNSNNNNNNSNNNNGSLSPQYGSIPAQQTYTSLKQQKYKGQLLPSKNNDNNINKPVVSNGFYYEDEQDLEQGLMNEYEDYDEDNSNSGITKAWCCGCCSIM